LEKLANKENYRKDGNNLPDNRWFPSKSEISQIRMIADPKSDDPFIELHFHYRVAGNKNILCLERNFGKECPLCNEGRRLAKTGSKEDKELGKKLIPRQRFFSYMIDRKDEEPKVRLWGFGVLVYKKLLSALLDDDYCNFLDPLSGLDSTIELQVSEGKDYPDTIFNFKRKESRLAATDEEIKNILSSLPQVYDVFKPHTDVQIRKILEDWLSFGDETNEGTEISSKKPEKSEEKELTQSVEDAFGEALEDL